MRKLAFFVLLAFTACNKDFIETPTTETKTTTTTNSSNTTTSSNTNTGTTTTTNAAFFPAETGNFQNDMLAYVNALRTKGCKCNGVQMPTVPALKWHKNLETAALRHANDMNSSKIFSHTGSDGSSMSQRITQAGYNWSSASENIAAGYTSLTTVVNGWVSSDGHCKNMMSASMTELGAAKVGIYWVQNFGKPR
jgi:uncharacterized protein YkwD